MYDNNIKQELEEYLDNICKENAGKEDKPMISRADIIKMLEGDETCITKKQS